MAELALAPARLAELAGHLDGPETARAERFARDADRDRFVAARGVLREILGRELGESPAAVALEADESGKPRLPGGGEVGFNASRSGERALVAVARGREVGVDVERVRADFDLAAVAARTLSPRELATWSSLPEPERASTFFAAWARKEAYAKGRGLGLALGMERIEAVPYGETGRHVVDDPDGSGPRWELADVAAGAGYAAAVATQGGGWRLTVTRL